MKNNLPTTGWGVKNDGSQQFKDKVVKSISKANKMCLSGKENYYGFDGIIHWASSIEEFKNGTALLTVLEFIEMSKIRKDGRKKV